AVKAELAKATGLSGDGLTLTELVYNAAYSFQKISTVATGLDAVVIPLDSEAQDGAVSDVQAESAPEPTQAASEPQEDAQEAPEVDLKAEVEKQTTKAGLQALFLKNKDAFNGDAELMAALQARFTREGVSGSGGASWWVLSPWWVSPPSQSSVCGQCSWLTASITDSPTPSYHSDDLERITFT